LFLDVDENMKDDGKHEDDKYRVYRKLYNENRFFVDWWFKNKFIYMFYWCFDNGEKK